MSRIQESDYNKKAIAGLTSKTNKTDAAGASSSSDSSESSSRSPVTPLFGIPPNLPVAPTLTGTDSDSFTQWKSRFKNYMKVNSISKIVTLPYKESLNEALMYYEGTGRTKESIQRMYLELHMKVSGIIATAIEPVLGTTIGDETEREQKSKDNEFIEDNANYMWNKLLTTYEKKSVYSTLSTFKELIQLQHDKAETPIQFRQRFESLVLQLNRADDVINAGEKISEGLKAAMVIHALPKSYDMLIQTLLAQTKPPTVETILTALQRQYDANEGRHSKNVGTGGLKNEQMNAFGSTDSSNSNRGGKNSRRGKSRGRYNNNRTNHDQEVYEEDTEAPTLPNKSVTFFFGEENNLFVEKKENSIDQSYETSYETNSDSDQQNEAVYSAQTDESISYPRIQFILDSGANRHIVYDRTLIRNERVVEPFYLSCALKKRVEIRKLGSVRVNRSVVLNNVACVPEAGVNLISMTQLLDAGGTIKIKQDLAQVSKENIVWNFRRIPGTETNPGGLFIYTLPYEFRRKMNTGLPSLQYSNLTGPLRKPTTTTTTGTGSVTARTSNTVTTSTKVSGKPNSTSSTTSIQSNPTQSNTTNSNKPVTRSTQANESIIGSMRDESINYVSTPYDEQLYSIQESTIDPVKLWHARMGHQSTQLLSSANEQFKLGLPKSGLGHLKECICDACEAGKFRRAQIGSVADSKWKATSILDCLHMDLVGPISVWNGKGKDRITGIDGELYSLQMVDEFSRTVFVELLGHKSDAADNSQRILS
jgi:hypothetical protein